MTLLWTIQKCHAGFFFPIYFFLNFLFFLGGGGVHVTCFDNVEMLKWCYFGSFSPQISLKSSLWCYKVTIIAQAKSFPQHLTTCTGLHLQSYSIYDTHGVIRPVDTHKKTRIFFKPHKQFWRFFFINKVLIITAAVTQLSTESHLHTAEE